MYHISDCKKYNRCPRLFLLSKQENTQAAFHEFVRLDEAVTDLAMEKLGVTDHFLGQRGDDPALSLAAMKDHDWLVKARFEYDGLRVKVPFLHRNQDAWDLYFLYVGLYPRAADIQFYADMIWVLEGNQIRIGDIRMVHLNADYVRGDALDPKELFTVSDCFYNDNDHPTISIAKKLSQCRTDLHDLLHRMDACTEETLPPLVRTSKCAGRQKCRFYEECFPEESSLPSGSVLTLIGAQHRYEMRDEGRIYLRDADEGRIEGTRQQYAQIMADRMGGLFADRIALRTWMQDVQYPISFLDFEWECYAIPPYKGMKPYDVLPFEYSLHVLHEDGTVDHEVFLSIHDDRRAIAESLVEKVPAAGTVIAYNATGAEQIRIRELADQFPEYREPLLQMNARMKDLQEPFLSGLVYDVRMNGSWTLKQIMSMMDDPGYNDLEIRHGMDAVFQWRHLDRGEEQGENASAITRELKEYCGMDSYAMVVVYRWLQSICSDPAEPSAETCVQD